MINKGTVFMVKLMIGDKFKKARKKLGWTQIQVCERVHISRIYYSNIERGIQIPKLETFILIANTLQVSDVLDDFLLPNTNRLNEMFSTDEFNGLSKPEFDIIMETIHLMASNFKSE